MLVVRGLDVVDLVDMTLPNFELEVVGPAADFAAPAALGHPAPVPPAIPFAFLAVGSDSAADFSSPVSGPGDSYSPC